MTHQQERQPPVAHEGIGHTDEWRNIAQLDLS